MNDALLTDKYQLVMNTSYVHDNRENDIVTFDLFIRNLPKDWKYYIAFGIDEAISYITNLKFDETDIDYLREQHFPSSFLDTLKDFKFSGDIWAVTDGQIVFPGEPLLRITAKRHEAQFIETALLNIVNFNTMIATKAKRIVEAAKPLEVAEFGLRRAQGKEAALKASLICYIAGCFATSNMLAGKIYGIPTFGTMAHSYVMGFEKEYDAFHSFARCFPNDSVFLIDTYDIIQGAKNAITVAKEMEVLGHKLNGVRIDNGNLCAASVEVRKMLDEANLSYVRIILSSDLNEYKISELRKYGKADIFGVGTEMVTAKPVAAISGVYKLVHDSKLGLRMKFGMGKKTMPGIKQVYRIHNTKMMAEKDIIALDSEIPTFGAKKIMTALLSPAIMNGERVRNYFAMQDKRHQLNYNFSKFPHFFNPDHLQDYPVEYSTELLKATGKLEEKYHNS